MAEVKPPARRKKVGESSKKARGARGAPKAKRTHDSRFPEAFCAFMMRDWRKQSTKLPKVVSGLSYFRKRRTQLSAAFPQTLLIVPTGHEKVRANDTYYPFRPGTDFYYLTGNLEPDCILVLAPKRGGHETILFVEPNPGRSDTTFFTDGHKGELWVGPRLGIAESCHRYGVDICLPIASFPAYLAKERAKRAAHRTLLLRQVSPQTDALLPESPREKDFWAHLSEMRLVKDAYELRAMAGACASTRRGFEDVIAALKEAKSEREVEGVFNLRARVEGNAVGYNTIAASGRHAGILHWSHNSGELTADDLILVDAGVESRELYTADVTRTLPLSGTFSPAQREVYDLVYRAQQAGLRAVKPGNDFMAPNRAAMEVLAHGLVDLGVLKDAADALLPKHQYYRRYTLHNVSHMLGIDVHDCAFARQQTYKYGALKVGMVLTVEPGLYFQPDDLTVPKRLRGIGVRIEDDVVVSQGGYRDLTQLPSTSVAVEAWMQQIWRQKDSPVSRLHRGSHDNR